MRNKHLNELFYHLGVYNNESFSTFLFSFTAKIERVRFYRVYDIFFSSNIHNIRQYTAYIEHLYSVLELEKKLEGGCKV